MQKWDWMIKVRRCQTGSMTNPTKEVWDHTIIVQLILIICRRVLHRRLMRGDPLVVYVCCCLCRPVGSQPAAEWMRTDSPCIWPIVPSLGLGLESFLLAALGAVARSKTSLLGCCRPSVQEGHHLGTVGMWYEQWCCVKGWCTGLPHGAWNDKSLICTIFSSSSDEERINLFGWKTQADI